MIFIMNKTIINSLIIIIVISFSMSVTLIQVKHKSYLKIKEYFKKFFSYLFYL